MSHYRLVVLISGRGSNLKAIIDKLDYLSADVMAIISNKAEAAGLAYAKAIGAKTHVVKHGNYNSREDFDSEMIKIIDSYTPDLVVLAGFMRILSDKFVSHYEGKLVNIHPSLLPKHKGTQTHQKALDAGDTEHGATVHLVSNELDSGPIIMQTKVTVSSEDTATSLAAKVLIKEHELYPKAIHKLLKGT